MNKQELLNNFDNNEINVLNNIDKINKELNFEDTLWINIIKSIENKILDFYLTDNKKINSNLFINFWWIDFWIDKVKWNKWFNLKFNLLELKNKILNLKKQENTKFLFNLDHDIDQIEWILDDFLELEIWDQFSWLIKMNNKYWILINSEKENNDFLITKFSEFKTNILNNIDEKQNLNVSLNLPIIVNNNLNKYLFISLILWIDNTINYLNDYFDWNDEIILEILNEIIDNWKNINIKDVNKNITIINKKNTNKIIEEINDLSFN